MAERDLVEQFSRFPNTRYQGSKRKVALDIVRRLLKLDFETVLDAFGGTGSVAYALKCAGKSVTYNDILRFNHQVGLALIENDEVRINAETIDGIGVRLAGRDYEDFIERTFSGVYYTDEENRWLDTAVGNLRQIPDRYVRALAWFAVCQAAIAKRPYNLFHRSNLYMRTADVSRSFGNKASWDRTFEEHVRLFAAQANAAVSRGDAGCRAICRDVLKVTPGFDLVYIDPPYINRSGVGVDYRDFYHFLEGMLHYGEWGPMIDRRSKHRRLQRAPDAWSAPSTCYQMLGRLFDHFRDSILAMSYRSDGIPTIPEIERLLREFKPCVEVVDTGASQYALSTRRSTRQVLLIGHG
jgi:adenine-specific DNA methylase